MSEQDRMDLQDATLVMAQIMLEERDFYEKYIATRRVRTAADQIKFEDDLKTHRILKAKITCFSEMLAADPAFFDVIEPWVVLVEGNESASMESLSEYEKNSQVEGLLERVSNLASSIKLFIRSRGYFITGMGAGLTGWDIGVRASEKESRELCVLLHQRFSRAIKLNLISVSRRDSGICLPGLYNYEDAERLIQLYGSGE